MHGEINVTRLKPNTSGTLKEGKDSELKKEMKNVTMSCRER